LREETAVSAVQHDTDWGEAKRQLAAVMEIANAINSKLDLDDILSTISKELAKVIDFDIGCVAIYEKDENCLYIRHITRRIGDKPTEERYVPLDESNLIGWVAIHKKPILRGNIPADTRFNEIMKEDNLSSDIVVPLIAKDTLIGTVNVGSYETDHFSEFDLELITKFSRLTAIAIEKSQLLQELNELGDKYRMLMNNATDVILLLNFSGEIIECTRSTYRLFEYSAEEILGKEFFLFITPNRRNEAKQIIYRILQGEHGRIVELPFLRKNGEIVYLETDATVMKVKGNPYVLVIGHDVTDRKRLQEKITIQNQELRVNNQKLLELDGLKSEFLGRISHELRTPLSVIMAYTNTLLEDCDGTIDKEMSNEFLHIIEEQSNKLLGAINDLLDLSKVEISETMLNSAEGSINEMIRISIKVVETFAQQNEIEIITSLDPLIPIIRFDPLRIRQVCINLLNNAIKFSRRNCSILISSFQSEREVIVSVSDTGPGIDQKDMPGIFDYFTQIDGGSARASDGMGIGLRLVKHYINLHRGRIWVESKKGEGSTFYFSLPKVDPMKDS
jgi:PAS domain S-box-containing protein